MWNSSRMFEPTTSVSWTQPAWGFKRDSWDSSFPDMQKTCPWLCLGPICWSWEEAQVSLLTIFGWAEATVFLCISLMFFLDFPWLEPFWSAISTFSHSLSYPTLIPEISPMSCLYRLYIEVENMLSCENGILNIRSWCFFWGTFFAWIYASWRVS